jgi:hypothetical protein
MKLKLATRWEVKVEGNKRSIQLFDAEGNKLEGSEARWEGDFNCPFNQLTSLEGAPREVGGSFSCSHNRLTSLEGAPQEVGGSFYCPNNRLITLEGAPKEIGGDFYCSHNQLTSLKGAPKEVGGHFFCDHNRLTSLEGIPKQNIQEIYDKINKRIFEAKLERGYVFADGILARLVSKRSLRGLLVFKVRLIGKKEDSFVVKRGDVFAHGETVKKATESLKYKLSDHDTTRFKKWKLNTKISQEDAIQAYRAITGACELGVKNFVESRKIPKTLTVKKVVELSKGQYGNEKFSRFFLKEHAG